MGALQAFLHVRDARGVASLSTFRDQAGVLSAWASGAPLVGHATGYLDIQFDELNFAKSLRSVTLSPGQLLLSRAAQLGVPALVSSDSSIVVRHDVVSAQTLDGSGVDALQRFRDRLSEIDRENPFAVAGIAPDGLLNTELRRLTLPRRVVNVFLRRRLRTVNDVTALGFDGLNKLKQFGEKSIRAFALALVEFLQSGEFAPPSDSAAQSGQTTIGIATASARVASNETVASKEPPPSPRPLRQALFYSLESLAKRDADVLCARLGRSGPPTILDDIGASLGVSRERVRQIESRAQRLVLARSSWPATLTERLSKLLSRRTEPLYLDLIAAEDQWFDGFQDDLPWLGRIIEQFGSQPFHVWELEGRTIVSRFSAERWPPLREAVLAALESQVETGLAPSEVGLMIEAIGAGMGAPELVDALDRSIRPSLHFARDANGCPRLVAVGRGLRPAILSIFEESERPLRFTEVRERLVDRGYPVPIDTTLRNAIRGSGMLLFGRSVYGTRAHIGMDPAALEETRAELIEIINEEPERQWHAAELAEELQDRGEVHTEIDHYKVGAILEGADDVAFLGRFVWMAKNRRGLSTRDRREVAQLFEAVLIRAGRPLKKKEIRAAIEHARGLNTTFLPQPTERVIRLGNGRWGLIDRDCRLSSEEMEPAFQGLESILTARGRALHTSELLPALANIGLDLPRALVEEFVGRAQIDQRFRVARGGYIVLATWQSTGRATLSEAYEKILKEWQGSVSTDEVQGRVETIIERPVHRWSVATWLNSLGLLFDQQSGRWEKPPENEDEATE